LDRWCLWLVDVAPSDIAQSPVLKKRLEAVKSFRADSKAASTRGPDPRKVDTSGVSYAAWVSVADVSASKSSGARRLHHECRRRV
ncbi:type IIL restriction-modification enzyme MmeI, partial [Corynebacterium striatum]|uniref:type IIL restriction-modification enzyme MmeI n=1 Tax=Corynebacterium striatum TaxID=43770 RepID=UPI003F7F66B5